MTSPASHDWPIGKQLGTLAFASAFVLGLPVLLTLWDLAAPAHFALWMPPSLVGVGIGVLGAGLYLWAIATYVARTGMLPVTLTSPDHAIVDGPFRLLNDPIYTGFCRVVAGAAIAVGHQFAFWIVTPTIILAT